MESVCTVENSAVQQAFIDIARTLGHPPDKLTVEQRGRFMVVSTGVGTLTYVEGRECTVGASGALMVASNAAKNETAGYVNCFRGKFPSKWGQFQFDAC